jgi:TonB-linked SusC/RagA family outer membrane protein
MKRVILAFLVIFMFTTMTVSAQKITMNLQQTKLEKVLSTIAEQSGYTFAYSQPVVNIDRIISIEVTDANLSQTLQKVFAGTNISYEIRDKKILLSEKNDVDQDNKPAQQSQKITVKGVAIDATGEPLIGASVSEKGTTNGIMTGVDGDYTLTVPANATLVITYVGYLPQEIALNGQTSIDFVLKEDSQMLDEVVVTALGIKKKEKSLTYSTQVIGGDELTRTKDPNMITALAGKTAGVQINKSSSGLGGSAKVIIRGNRSASGNNQPLYVIDGVPMNNTITDQTSTSIGGTNDAGNRDGGDGISNLNPDDIESMNILKGPSAAALYGSQAANGVIVITTKKGKVGRTSITFNSNTTFDKAAYGIPDFQNTYTGTDKSWGEKITNGGKSDYAGEFFNTGVTTINSIALSSGSEKMQTYFSYANTYAKGVIENNNLMKHNFNFRETANFFDDKLTLDANINLLYQRLNNGSTPGGYYMNPLVGLYHFPRGGVQGGESFNYYKANYQRFNEGRNMYIQNWYGGFSDMDQNPYWLVNKTPSEDVRLRTIANLSLNYKITKDLTIQARGTADYISDKYNQKMYVGTHNNLAGENGRYITYEATMLSTYADLLLTYQKQIDNNFSLSASLGTSITDQRNKSLRLDSRPGSLFFPNVFTVANMNLNGGYITEENLHTQSQSVFFAGQLGFRDYLFLDVTARNDWTSTLAYTKSADDGFFYPSIGLTWVINESVKLPDFISFGKLRGSWAKVGNGLPAYISRPINTIAAGGSLVQNGYAPFDELKPEMTKAWEFGTEWKFLNNRIDFDFTFYKTNTTNQLFTMPAPAGSGYSYYYINAGDIENKGIEIVLGGSPVMTDDFLWKTSVNFAKNTNKVKELATDLDFFKFGDQNSSNYQMRLYEGGSFGDIYGRTFARDDNGNILYGDNGLPYASTGDFEKIANSAPKFNLGWSNTFKYKDFSLYFLIDGRFGGDVLSITQADLDMYGVTKRTGEDRDRGYVNFDGKQIKDIKGFYDIVGGRSGITEYYVESATNIRLRELSFGYKLPAKLFANKFIRGCELSFVGKNLFFFKNNASYDPDASLSTGNNLQGIDVFGMPSLRSFGFNLKLDF